MGRDQNPEDPRASSASTVRDVVSPRSRPARHEGSQSLDRSDRPARHHPDPRQSVPHRGQTYRLRDSELQLLETIGTFRVVAEADLSRDVHDQGRFAADVRSLSDQRLLERVTVCIHRRPARVLVLTSAGKSLLEARPQRTDGPRQAYHAGLVKPRELAHDAQLYGVYRAEAARIEARGGRVTRVVLDYEIKRSYQQFLNRRRPRHDDSSPVVTGAQDRDAFAATHRLPVVDDHLEIPDLRIEYETEDDRLDYRDVELITEQYSRSQVAGKRAAGFQLYRAGGASSRKGGTPYDPRYVETLT
jgi:hypothetical protein